MPIVSLPTPEGGTVPPGYAAGDVLCHRHVRDVREVDRYAFAWLDLVAAGSFAVRDTGTLVPNPRPDLLVRWAYSVVWRFSEGGWWERLGGAAGQHPTLGPLEPAVRAAIFSGDLCPWPVSLSMASPEQGPEMDSPLWMLPSRGPDDQCWGFRFLPVQVRVDFASTLDGGRDERAINGRREAFIYSSALAALDVQRKIEAAGLLNFPAMGD